MMIQWQMSYCVTLKDYAQLLRHLIQLLFADVYLKSLLSGKNKELESFIQN